MIAPQLLAWWDKHGRKHLPWQKNRSPYRIWVSEIMLQQTRVETVMPYFERFMSSFPDVQALAAANDDDVMAIWAGLGYYSRAHNLLKAARIVVTQHGGELPRDFDSLVAMPGIGDSTAGAILALAHGQRKAILDGNARRVLARVHAVEGWPGKSLDQQEAMEPGRIQHAVGQGARLHAGDHGPGRNGMPKAPPPLHRVSACGIVPG